MFFSSKITSTDVVEMLHSTDVVKVCPEKLKEECEESSFGLSDTYLDAHDIKSSLKEIWSESTWIMGNIIWHIACRNL